MVDIPPDRHDYAPEIDGLGYGRKRTSIRKDTIKACAKTADREAERLEARSVDAGSMNAREIAEHNTILRATVGSTAHGLGLDGQDDRDEMGVCIEPPQCVIGLRHFEQWTARTKPEGVRSGPGDLDLTIYSLRKWARLALRGNPTILILLFTPDVIEGSRLGSELRAMAPAFAARSAAKAFIGYMVAQRMRLTGERGGMRVRRQELVEAHGYDTKYAGHILRLGEQGIEFLSTGRFSLPMSEAARRWIMTVRRGEVSLADVLTAAGELERTLRDLEHSSPLPEEPDRDAVDAFLIRAYREHWAEKSMVPLSPWWLGESAKR